MIPYILHVALLISVCLLFYKLLLQKETFYRLNRWVLVFCMALSFGLPLIPIPQQWTLRETTAATETAPTQPVNNFEQNIAAQKQAAIKAAITSGIKANARPKVKTVLPANVKAVNPVLAKTAAHTPATITTTPATATATNTTPLLQRALKLVFYIYWIGVAAFGLNLLLQLVVLLYQAYTKPVIKDGKFRIIELSGDKAPCSFGNNIFINPEKYDWETYSQILLHEKIHIQQGHSFDILIAELVLVLQWFNPFAWLYRTEVESNLEFLTDDSVLEHKEIERASYQMSLLKVSAPHLSLGITTNYNQSLLKRRILMMNSKRSNIHTMWKYFFLVPLLGILACALNDPEVYAQVAKMQVKNHVHQHQQHFSSNTETEGSWFATIKNDRVRMEFRSDSDDHNWSSNSDFKLNEFSSLPRDHKGDFTLTREAGTVLFNGKFDGDQGYGHYKFTANKDFKAFLGEHGISGIESGDEFAFFMINIKKDYVTMLESNGYKHLSKDGLISMGALKVDEPYIRFWKENGYPNLTTDELVSGKALGITADYISDIRKAGYTNLTFDQLVSFKATGVTGKFITGLHGRDAKTGKPGHVTTEKMNAEDIVSVKTLNVDENYIASLQKAGYTNVPLNELTSMKAVGVTPEFIEGFKAAGYNHIPANELVSMKSVGVTPAYVKSLATIGYNNISADELVSMKSVGVTPEYVANLKASGYGHISANDLVSMKSVGASPEFAKGFARLGYKNIPAGELVSMKAVGVTPEFAESFKTAGYGNISVNDLVSIKSMGITPEFARSFESVGYKNIPYNELTGLKALGITPAYIKSFQDAGFKNINLDTFSGLKSMGITPEFIESFKKIGYTNITLDEATSLKATGVTPEYVNKMREKGFKSQDLNKYIELKNAFNEDNK